MTAAVTQLKLALAQIVVQQGLIPSTTPSAPILAGALSFPLASLTGFVPGGLVKFLDGSDERTCVIDRLDTGTVYIDSTLSGGAIRSGHSTAAMVVTNLTQAMPVHVATMFASGRPVVSVNVLDRTIKAETNGLITPRYIANICHLLPLDQMGSPLDPQVWTEDLTKQAESDIEALELALHQNYSLEVGGTSFATWVERTAVSHRGNATDYDVPCWETWLDVWIRGDDIPF